MTTHSTPVPIEKRLTLKTRFPDEEDCALCLQSMKGSIVMRLPCGHHYHERCHARLRETAGSYRYRCPTCRHNVKEQVQRLKVYELWGDDLWKQFMPHEYVLCPGANPLENESGKHKLDAFECWLLQGLSEEEIGELVEFGDIEPNSQHVIPLQNLEVPPSSPVSHETLGGELILDALVDESEQYFASLTLSDDDESQPDSP